ncbi:MAG: sensor signal transduction histidine kinase [Frankiales bacterium]|nr:sensor signal transduction histidine kinase [Frankiales bacterium]
MVDGLPPAAYDDLPDAVVATDDGGTVILVNAAAQRMLGLGEHSLGQKLGDVLGLTDDQGRDWWACSRPWDGLDSRTRQPERRLTLTNGRSVLVTGAYVRDAERALVRFVVSLRDDAARERIDRSRADLVSTVAHELRSPLTSVKGFTATLLARWDRFNDDQKKVMLETVNADADRVTRLLTDLLDVSRIDAGRIEMRRQVVDLPQAVRKAVAGRVASGEPEDRFAVAVHGALGELWADPDKIDQVVGNLIENALRHGDGTVSIDIRPWDDEGDGGVEVLVSD